MKDPELDLLQLHQDSVTDINCPIKSTVEIILT
jgi:hypothetical protein